MSRRLFLLFLLVVLPSSVFAILFNPPLEEGIEFPETIVNETSTVDFIVSEPNDVQPVVVRIDQPQQDEFSVEPNEQILRAGEQVVFRVSFSPEEAGEVEGRLTGSYFSPNGGRPIVFGTDLFGVGIAGEDPVIEVRPLELSLELVEPGDRDEATVDVGNGGEGDLEFEVIIAEECDWLDVEPEGGEIAGGSDQIIQLTFNTTDVIPDSGSHNTEVVISSNDPENEAVIVDVTLHVAYQPAPAITVNVENIELSITEFDQHVQDTLTISNDGERILEFEIAVPEVPWLEVNPLAGELEPGMEQAIVVEGIHSSQPNDEYEVDVIINSNDPENDEISFNVRLVVDIEDNVPRITLSADMVMLEIREADQQAIDTVLIGNSGYQPLVFALDIPLDQNWFDAQPDTGIVEPDATIEIVIFTTDQLPENGEYESSIGITSNDPENSEVSIEVHLIVDIQGVSDRSEFPLLQGYHLSAPFPNPFNSQSIITYVTPRDTYIKLSLYDITGRYIRQLTSEWASAGRHQVVINGENLAAGVYVVKYEAGGMEFERKIQLVK